ncbi:S-layer homology domain-containing protein [Desulforamulus hydrothermalis]|uniref:S-layer domain-containing protein n=1 Tax=Desulforamulus hydrothermalis Lam5 = DSM 18033 TaxID=1121428 RepID=K8E8X2_9FIRM|nr:S-layer homology domain-containing protein [Desulforamulus hydrothermalis]CCO07963.1 S-layer domain-containing protein [Desulforamulus hydrothermalis Lam5 = DSM 18033]SHG85269.1 S-layer homology domain-containing protein [Desulforamulus hydrothermalis Lam5 = DSM 18033]
MKRKPILLLVLVVLLTFSANAALAGDLQQTLLDKLPQPKDKLTRAEFIAMLVQAAALPAPASPVTLPPDVPADAWYAGDLKAALAAGIISGSAKQTVNPNQPITQAQAVVLLSRVLRTPGIEAPGPLPTPVPNSHWAFVPFTWLIKEGLVSPAVNPEAHLTPAEGAALLDKAFGSGKLAKEIMEKSQAAQAGLKTLRGTGNMSMIIKANPAVPVQGVPSSISMQAKVNYEINTEQGLHQQLSMNFGGLPQTMPAIEMEQYMVAEGMYMKMKDPLTAESKWMKMPAGSMPDFVELMQQQNKFMQLPSEFDKYFRYRLVGEKTIGQKNYYELAYFGNIPDLNQFMKMLGSHVGMSQDMLKSFEQSGSIVRSITMTGKILVDKEKYFADQSTASAVVVFNDKLNGQPFPMQLINATFNFSYQDYGSKIDIKLPAEAAKAEVLPLDAQVNSSTN